MELSINAPVLPESLLGRFGLTTAQLGVWDAATASSLPDFYRRLLAHEHHMTVTVESFHGCAVDVEVLDRQYDEAAASYARLIRLRKTTDQSVVQFGIMQINLAVLGATEKHAILAEETPLGRVLIENNVLRKIRLLGLWRIVASPLLAQWLECESGRPVYGRTATMDLNGAPAIDLLEIVRPEPET